MTAGSKTTEGLRSELLAEIGRQVASHPAEQNHLILQVLEEARSGANAVEAGVVCLRLCRALGLRAAESRQVAVIAGCVELAAMALRRLDVRDQEELPLSLNAADGLYSLAQVALAEFRAQEGGGGRLLASSLDAASLDMWEAAAGGPDEGLHYFADAEVVARAAARLAGKLAARAAGRSDSQAGALATFAELAVAGSTGEEALAPLKAAGVAEHERRALGPLLESPA